MTDKKKSRTRSRWEAQRKGEFEEIKTDDDFIEDYEDAYPEFFNPVFQMQKKITDSAESNLDSLLEKPVDSMDAFIKAATETLIKEESHIKKEQQLVQKETEKPPSKKDNLQFFIMLVRESLLILLILKILILGFKV